MTPLTELLTELRLAVERSEARARDLQRQRAYMPDGLRRPPRTDLEDHRTEAIADLLDALDRVDPPLGTRLLAALYPFEEHLRPTALPGLFASAEL